MVQMRLGKHGKRKGGEVRSSFGLSGADICVQVSSVQEAGGSCEQKRTGETMKRSQRVTFEAHTPDALKKVPRQSALLSLFLFSPFPIPF